VQHIDVGLQPQQAAHRRRGRSEAELHDMSGEVPARLAHRRRGVAERAEGQALMEGRADNEPAGPVPGLDQALDPQLLQGAAHGGAGDGIPSAQLCLGLHGTRETELTERDALAHIVRDLSEASTCHELVSYRPYAGRANSVRCSP